MTLRDCYKLLRVAENASEDVVKQAYRKRAFELHPDLHPDDPNASRKFQQLNEAYVIITSASGDSSSTSRRASGAWKSAGTRSTASNFRSAKAESDSTVRDKARAAYTKAKRSFSASQARSNGSSAKRHPEFDDSFWTKEQQGFSKESVLNEILNDPFAKRVFEDIYREIKRDGGNVIRQVKKKSFGFNWGERKVSVDMSGGVKGWMQRQLDDKQEMRLPMQNLRPGAKVRLTLSQGLNGATRQVEVTLPSDFRTGVPIRLRKLGRKLGGWTGDLYLTIYGRM